MSNINDIDTDIQNYTISEMMVLLDLQEDELTSENIISSSQNYINMASNAGEQNLATFFNEVEEHLLNYVDGQSDDSEQVGSEDESEGDGEENDETESEKNNTSPDDQASEWLKKSIFKTK